MRTILFAVALLVFTASAHAASSSPNAVGCQPDSDWCLVTVPDPMSLPAKTATADNRNNIVGIGRSTCAAYTEALQTNPQEVKSQFAVWAYGFLSGMNVAEYPKTKDFSSILGMGTDAFVKDVNIYCNQHARETLDRALVAFYARLPSTPPQAAAK
jgi:hypothetical protein